MDGSSVAKTKISRLPLILKIVPLRSPTYRFSAWSNAIPVRPGKGDVDVAFEIHRRICDRMKIVRDLQSDVYGMRLAFVAGSGHAHRASVRAFRDARDQPALAGQRQAGFRLAEA